jgi:glycosyltransferase involved in cell wall biosynthesis
MGANSKVKEGTEGEKMKLSFIVPVYKTEKYLEKCLQSLLNQDYENIEIICVLDGKSKKAEKIIKGLNNSDKARYKKNGDGNLEPTYSNIQYFTIKHSGVQRARNYGFDKSTGDIVSFFDSDCYLEPGVAYKWMRMLEVNKEVDFVYSGYKFTTGGGISSEEFDPFTLRVSNYISTMFPLRREVFPGFDENLESLQDWDMWLTIVENGSKGIFIPGYDFITEPPHKQSISGIGCTNENWLGRVKKVKAKHDILLSDICITSPVHKYTAIRMAKYIGADFHLSPAFKPHEYKLIYLIGFYPQDAIAHVDTFTPPYNANIVIHWTGLDIMWMHNVAFKDVQMFAKAFKEKIHHHTCENVWAKEQLINIGIDKNKISILQLPAIAEDVKPLPKKPKVLIDTTNTYRAFAETIKKAMPDIEFDLPTDNVNVDDYTLLLKITEVNVVDDEMKKFLIAGRHVVSNIQGYKTNYIPLGDPIKTKKKYVSTIRKLCKSKALNKKAMDFYSKALNLKSFKKVLEGYKNA